MGAKEHNQYGPGWRTSQVQHHEIRNAETHAPHLLPRLQAMAKQNPKLKLLDIGCGSGTITTSFAKHMPEGAITGADLGQPIVDRATELAAAQGVENVTFRQASAYELPFEDGSFDITHAHQMLCHMDDPPSAIREMVRVTRPGGVVALREGDMGSWTIWPDVEELWKLQEVTQKTVEASGGQPTGGREIIRWALDAGVPRDEMTMTYGIDTMSSPEQRKNWAESMEQRLRDGVQGKKAVEMGLVTEEEVDRIAKAWIKWRDTEDANLGIVNGELIIQKKQ